MRIEEIRSRLEITPFRPFRMHVSDGAAYTIKVPHHVFLTRICVHIGLEPDESGFPTRTVYVDPVHVTRLTPIDSKKRNGKQTK